MPKFIVTRKGTMSITVDAKNEKDAHKKAFQEQPNSWQFASEAGITIRQALDIICPHCGSDVSFRANIKQATYATAIVDSAGSVMEATLCAVNTENVQELIDKRTLLLLHCNRCTSDFALVDGKPVKKTCNNCEHSVAITCQTIGAHGDGARCPSWIPEEDMLASDKK